MIFRDLRKELANNIDGIQENDIMLLEGKLLFLQEDKANLVKKYLLDKFIETHDVIESTPRNWRHWSKTYVKELYLQRRV
jgi:hypothetical protein